MAALELDNNSSHLNHNVGIKFVYKKGVALYALKRYLEALKYFDAAIAIEYDSPQTLN